MLPVDGVLTTERSLLYRVPKNKRAELANIVMVNNSGVQATVNLYVNLGSGALRPVFPVNTESLQLGAGRMTSEQMPLILSDGHELHGSASADNAVSWVLCGNEQ